MTAWLSYPTQVFQLGSGQRTQRTFMVAVPATAAPGEYIASLVLEHEVLPQVGAAVQIDEVVRQAIAVVVTVPGPRAAAIDIGGASHEVVAGKSIVSIAVSNTGNVRLKPLIDFTLSDAAGSTVSHANVAMDSFYAQTATTVEVPLNALLLPGRYTVRFVIGDTTQKLAVSERSIPLVVEAPPAADPVIGAGTGLTDLLQGFGEDSMRIWGAVVAGLLGLGIVLIATSFAARRRRRRGA